jgi:hypothetical protein
MTSFSFNQLIAENQQDPQWLVMVQSLLNYKQKLVEIENNSTPVYVNLTSKNDIIDVLTSNYKLHTNNGTQYIRRTHLTAVLNDSKLLKSDVVFSRDFDYVKLMDLVQWIYEKNAKIKKVWLKKYGN